MSREKYPRGKELREENLCRTYLKEIEAKFRRCDWRDVDRALENVNADLEQYGLEIVMGHAPDTDVWVKVEPIKEEEQMKYGMMLELRERSEVITNASNVGFDFPDVSEALAATKDRLTEEDIDDIKSELTTIIDGLEGQDLGDLIDWIFEKGNIRNTTVFFESLLGFYKCAAEMHLDKVRAANPLE